ncbi:MAG: DUF2238 domain-containing protein [Acidobacteria bacterium]|nr:DUF2238 domain-containing protein [Acidobacteriota bacterium]MCB9397189.1 DUF2238 domain-containing protein [Acidobacteriota bacterium]
MKPTLPKFCLFAVGACFIWSAWHPHDTFTWFLEVAPVLIGLPLACVFHQKYRLTQLLIVLISLHAIILMVGGHYTYAEVPLFDTFREWFGWSRNHYDRVGHFAQGFVPAILIREWFIRVKATNRYLFLITVCGCLAFSAFYELIEWAVAISTGTAAEAFLGTQGDPWDTQNDMFLALCGAILAQLFLARYHQKQLAQLA